MSDSRTRLVEAILKASGEERKHRLDESIVMDAIVPQPRNRATDSEVTKFFVDGVKTCPGAYRIAEMTQVAKRLDIWKEKLSDSYVRYVREELDILRQSIRNPTLKKKVRSVSPMAASHFVRDILHFRLEDGTLLRNHLSNLEERAASRNALKIYFLSQGVLDPSIVDNPLCVLNRCLNQIVKEAWQAKWSNRTVASDNGIRRLLLLNALLNTLDTHKLGFGQTLAAESRIRDFVAQQFDAATREQFFQPLGGDVFLREFLDRWLSRSGGRCCSLVYLTHTNGQLVVSLKCIEAFLTRQRDLTIVMVPKSEHHGNEASWEDVENLLDSDMRSSDPIFEKLRSHLASGHLIVCRDGPRMQGLHPGCLSKELCYHLRKADVVVAEGQAYAEMHGWIKPTYLLFQVKGRVAEAIHGVARQDNALAFVRVGYGALHFSHPERLSQRIIKFNPKASVSIHVYGQTTADYIKAILSDNYCILRDRFFDGDEEGLFTRLRKESESTGKTMAEIVLGTQVASREEVQKYRKTYPPDVFAIGGGGGFSQVTLKALRMLDVRVAAGVPSTDDGGSTGRLQTMIAGKYGYMFGMGDAAAILEQQVVGKAKWPILSYRLPEEPTSLTEALVEHILREVSHPTIEHERISDCPDFLSFVCEQMNFARVIDEHFLKDKQLKGFRVKGASIRNLNILAAFFVSGAIKCSSNWSPQPNRTNAEKAEQAWFLLEEALGLSPRSGKSIRTLPVTYDQASIWARYNKPIPKSEEKRLRIPHAFLSTDLKTVRGQQYIDQIIPTGRVVDFGIAGTDKGTRSCKPKANPAYLEALQTARLVIMGAGSLFSSQLSQLVVPGVIDELIRRQDIRKVLIVNHVCMNETMFYSLTDHIKAIERLANKVACKGTKHTVGRTICIGDIFTDVVIPRTVAREVDIAMRTEMTTCASGYLVGTAKVTDCCGGKSAFVNPDGSSAHPDTGILRNRYVAYILDHPEFRVEQQVTDWELRVLGYLEQPSSLYHLRSEAGRYRGAVYAVQADIDYLLSHGIPPRHIYEVEIIGMCTKILKAEGKPQVEEFPGLTPESLVGIFKILLEKGAPSQSWDKGYLQP